MFNIEYGSQPKRFLKKCEKAVSIRIVKAADKLAEDPFPKDVKRVEGEKFKAFRIRVGDFRIKYVVDYAKKEIGIYEIEKRERAY